MLDCLFQALLAGIARLYTQEGVKDWLVIILPPELPRETQINKLKNSRA